MSEINLDNVEKSSFVKESIRILHEAYISKKLVLFIGAGADVLSGLPLWSEAIKEFCNHMSIDSDGADNLRIPQYYYNSRGKKEYVELCRDIFDYGKFNLEWLKMYSAGLLDEISKNNTARYEISKIYADKVEHGEIDARLLQLYFKHFANVVEEK